MRLVYMSALFGGLIMGGCESNPPRKVEVVTVDKPVLYIPTPPTIPQVPYMVDQLTPEDVKDPGKVGMAYKHDMFLLRGLVTIQNDILDQYRKSSVDFTNVNKAIDQLYDQSKRPVE